MMGPGLRLVFSGFSLKTQLLEIMKKVNLISTEVYLKVHFAYSLEMCSY